MTETRVIIQRNSYVGTSDEVWTISLRCENAIIDVAEFIDEPVAINFFQRFNDLVMEGLQTIYEEENYNDSLE